MRKSILATILFLFIGSTYSDTLTPTQSSAVEKIDATHAKTLRDFRLKHYIEGWSLNCSKSYLFAWGAQKNISKDSAQASTWTLIDLRKKRIIMQKHEGFGIYQAIFLTDKKSALIEYGRGQYIVLIQPGKIKYFNIDDTSHLKPEVCQ